MLTRGDLLTGLAKQSQLAPVADVMQRNVCTADVGEMVESRRRRLGKPGAALAVAAWLHPKASALALFRGRGSGWASQQLTLFRNDFKSVRSFSVAASRHLAKLGIPLAGWFLPPFLSCSK